MEQLSLPGIEYVPQKVRRHGLREFHNNPQVSYGKDHTGRFRPVWREAAEQAWKYPELELGRTANSIPTLLFDMDRDPTDWLVDVFGPSMPLPNWITFRRENKHAHIAYTLSRPVLTGEKARPTPQAMLARAGEYLAAKLQADAAYNAVLAHNPMSWASRGRYQTDWLRKEPYSLAELIAFIPKGWRRPARPFTVYGRNDYLFRAGMKWTGQPSHWGDWVGLATYLAALNAAFDLPLGTRELGGIIKSVRKIQAKNLRIGQTQQNFAFLQSIRGQRSGAARRKGTPLEHDPTPWQTASMSRRTWYRYTRTGQAHRESIEQRRPWEAEGISRRTWYRRKKKHDTPFSPGLKMDVCWPGLFPVLREAGLIVADENEEQRERGE